MKKKVVIKYFKIIFFIGSILCYTSITSADENSLEIVAKLKISLLDKNDSQYIPWLYELAGIYIKEQRFSEAEPLLIEIVDLRKNFNGYENPETLVSMNQLATLYFAQDKLTKSTDLYEHVLSIRNNVLGKGHPETVKTLKSLLAIYELTGNKEKRLLLYVQILKRSREGLGDESEGTLENIKSTAGLYQELGYNKEAEKLFKEAFVTSSKILGDNHADTISTIDRLALLYHQQKRYKAAEPLFKNSFELSLKVLGEMHPNTLQRLNNLAVLYFDTGKYDQSEVMLNQVFNDRELLLGYDHPDTLDTLFTKAKLFTNKGQYFKAENIHTEILQIRREVLGEEHLDTINSLINLAKNFQNMGRYNKALPLFKEASIKRKKVLGEQDQNTLIAMSYLADLYADMGEFTRAERMFIDIHSKMVKLFGRKHVVTLKSYSHLASLYQDQGRYKKAEVLSLEIMKDKSQLLGENHPDTLMSINQVAVLYIKQNKHAQAKILLKSLLKKSRVALGDNNPDTLVIKLNLASILQGQHSTYVEAIALYESILNNSDLNEFHSLKIISINNLSILFEKMGALHKAEIFYKKALAASTKTNGIGHPETFQIMSSLAGFYQSSNEHKKAFKYWKQYLNASNQFLLQNLWGTSESTRKSYLRNEHVVRGSMLSLYSSLDNKDSASEAVNYSLSRKGIQLNIASQISRISKASADPYIKGKVELLRRYKGELASIAMKNNSEEITRQITKLRSSIEKIEGELGKSVNELGNNQRQLKSEDLFKAMDPQEVLIDFHIYNVFNIKNKTKETEVLAIVINQNNENQIQMIKLGDARPIANLIRQYRTMIKEGSTKNQLSIVSKKLYNQLWKPLIPSIDNTKKIVISPDGILNLLPFSVLESTNGKALMQVNDLSIVATLRDVIIAPPEVVTTVSSIFAGPLYSPDQKQMYSKVKTTKPAITHARSLNGLYFSALPGALEEGQVIVDLFELNGLQQTHFYLENAREEELKKLKSPKILHLASHGFFLESVSSLSFQDRRGIKILSTNSTNSTNSTSEGFSLNTADIEGYKEPLLQSGIAFANANLSKDNGESDDGILSAMEAISLHLDGTKLVVLSACDTGVGEIQVGEGVYGLQRAFQEAGAQAVLYTLWPINDEGTRYFMELFYENYLNGQSPQEALRNTQRNFISHEKWNSPLYWAGFVVSGKDL